MNNTTVSKVYRQMKNVSALWCGMKCINILCYASGFRMLLFIRQVFMMHVCACVGEGVCVYVCVCCSFALCSATEQF